MKKLDSFSLSSSEWNKHFPALMNDKNPVRRTAAEVISRYHKITV